MKPFDESQEDMYIRSQIWPKFKDGMTRADVVKAMKLDGISEDFLKEDYNGQSFAAYIREIEQAGELLPEHLSKVVEPSEKFNLVRLKFGCFFYTETDALKTRRQAHRVYLLTI
jgi:hypothetical protein